jgi:hypothetical protein
LLFVLVPVAAAITHDASLHEARVQRKGQDVQTGIALARKGNTLWGRECDSECARALQWAVSIAAAGAAGDGEVDVVECEDEDSEVRACGEDLAGSGKDLVDGGLGLCGARGEGEMCERGERYVGEVPRKSVSGDVYRCAAPRRNRSPKSTGAGRPR